MCMITARLCGLCPFSRQSPESAYNTCTCLYSAWTGTLNFCLEQGKCQKGSWPLSAVFTFCFNNSSELNKSEPSSVKNPSASRLFLFSHTLGHTRSFCAWPNFIHLLHHLQVLAPLYGADPVDMLLSVTFIPFYFTYIHLTLVNYVPEHNCVVRTDQALSKPSILTGWCACFFFLPQGVLCL